MSDELSVDDRVGELVEEFLAQLRAGERPRVEQVAGQHPELADELRSVLSTLALIEQVKHDDAQSAAPADAPRLEQLGDYRILREIGRGGMGVVYEAEQESLGRHVALKVLMRHSLLDPRFLKRFQREARTAAQLHHTNIVPVFGVGESQGIHYFVMQYIAGRGLDEVIRELAVLRAAPTAGNGQASTAVMRAESTVASQLSHTDRGFWRRVAQLGADAAGALHYAHSHGTLHRDVKPSNLLLDAAGIVWITDFGLARTLDEEDLTSSSDVLGTLRYLAPEALDGRFDARSDVYSLGLALYELCALRPARDATSREELVRQATRGDAVPLGKVARDAPRDLETIISKAIEPDPARRYQSAAELADDLERFCGDRPIAARRVAPTERAWRWCRRNPALASTITAAVLVVLVTAIVAFVSIANSRNEALAALGEIKVQRQNALTEKANADRARTLADQRAEQSRRNADLARKAVEESLLIISEDTRLRASGLEPLRRSLAEAAQRFYDQLVDTNPNEDGITLDRAYAYIRLAQLMWELGEGEEAIALRRKADELFDQVGRRHSLDPKLVRLVANNLARQGELYMKLDRQGEARDRHERALRMLADLVNDRQRAEEASADASVALSLVGKNHLELADLPRAEAAFVAALGARNRQPRNLPAPGRALLADLLFDLGTVYFASDRLPQAEVVTRAALNTYQALARANPVSPTYPELIAETEESLGKIIAAAGRPAEAEPILRHAVETFEPLLKQRPEVRRYLGGLARRRLALAVLYRDTQRYDEASSQFGKAIDLFAERVEKFPATTRYHRDLADARIALGQLHLATDPPAAQPHFDQAIAAYERLAREHADEPLHQYKLACAWLAVGRSQQRRERWEGAAQAFAKSEELLQRLAAAHADESLYARRLAECFDRNADVSAKLGHAEQAAAARSRAVELRSKLPDAPPVPAGFEDYWAGGHELLSQFDTLDGREQLATDEIRVALDARRKLADERPRDADRQRDLAITFHRLARVAVRFKHADQADDAHRQSLDIFQRLVRESPAFHQGRLDLANAYLIFGKPLEAAEQAAAVAQANDLKPGQRFAVANAYARAAGLAARGDSASAGRADEYARAAMSELTRLVKDGELKPNGQWFKELQSDADFESLRARGEVRRLLDGVAPAAQ